MLLRILLPSKVFLEAETVKVLAEAENGHFCLEPRHVDFVSILVPGVLTYVENGGRFWYVALDEGILVKRGEEVRISTYKAIRGARLEILREKVETEIRQLDEAERATRSALARLEVGILRRYGRLSEVLK